MRLAALLVCLALPAMAAPPADVTILGEVHDNPSAHVAQAEAIRAIRPTAVVFEMLSAEEAARADADRSLIATEWQASGWGLYPLYEPIFEAMGDAHIVGAAAPRDKVRGVYKDGPAALFGPEASRYGLDQPLPEAERTLREKDQFDAHCGAMPMAAMAGMVDIQRYRDAAFARATLGALDKYGPPVVLIVGNGHARTDWGVPAMIARAAPQVTTHAIAFTEGSAQAPYDAVHEVPPVKRKDPCAALTGD